MRSFQKKIIYGLFIASFLSFQGCSTKNNTFTQTCFYDKYNYNYNPFPIIYQVIFPFNKATLNKSDELKLIAYLKKQKKIFDTYPLSYPIYYSIEASCDACGSYSYNTILGKKRIKYIESIIKKIFKRKTKYLTKINLSKKFSTKCEEKIARFSLLIIDINSEF